MEEKIATRNLPKGAKTKITADGKEVEVTFNKMDGMYGQWFDSKGEMFVFNADFVKDGDFYKIANPND